MEAKELERLIACAELRNPGKFNASRERYIAEISFKAGQEEESTQAYHTGLADGVARGRREVVEWIENQSGFGIPYTLTEQSKKDWQAKLKEWGIDG